MKELIKNIILSILFVLFISVFAHTLYIILTLARNILPELIGIGILLGCAITLVNLPNSK